MTLWWELYPERLEFELQALNAAGIPFEPVVESVQRGIYQLKVRPTIDGEIQELIVTFPDHYPFFRFEITAPSLALQHHQHPFGKALCFIGRETFYWRTSDTVAEFLKQRLGPVLTAGKSTTQGMISSGLEQPRAEPFSDYYPYAFAICHVDSSWRISSTAMRGTLTCGVLGFFFQGDQPPCLQSVVLSVTDERGVELATIPPEVNKFRNGTFRGRWVRLDRPLETGDPQEAFRVAQQHDGNVQPAWATFGNHRLQLYGILFPDEVRHRELGDGWLFVVKSELLPNRPTASLRKKHSPPKMRVPPRFYFARSGRIGRADMVARSPELLPLRDRVIAQVGLGALGGPSSLEFARAGVKELRLVDDDFVDPATGIRWPFGLPVAGRPKVQVIGERSGSAILNRSDN